MELDDEEHWSNKSADEMNERHWRIFREDHEIIIKGGRVPIPMRKWDEGKLPDYVVNAINKLNYEKPTPI